jgi:hypothetical protein
MYVWMNGQPIGSFPYAFNVHDSGTAEPPPATALPASPVGRPVYNPLLGAPDVSAGT